MLLPPDLAAPPRTPAIPSMWIIQHKVIQPPKGNHPDSGSTVSVDAARQLGSAAVCFYEGRLMLRHPHTCAYDPVMKLGFVKPGRHRTQHLSFTHMTRGLRRHLGVKPRPKQALQLKHIQWNLNDRQRLYRGTSDPWLTYELAAACTVETFSFLGWLSGGKIFGQDEEDVEHILDVNRPHHGLPPGIGFINLLLNPSTKSYPDRQVDVVIANETLSGLKWGQWCSRLLAA